jgi:hypothetical protein
MKRSSHVLRNQKENNMNRILKISLISVGSVAATALVSTISYVKGKQRGIQLMQKKYEGQLGAGANAATTTQPQA